MEKTQDFEIEKNGEEVILKEYKGNASEVVIPDCVTSIGDHAFFECDSLTSIEISSSVTSISYSAFWECSSLRTVFYGGTSSDWSKISIGGSGNYYLTDAIRYYYSETPPTTTVNYWHYVNGKPTIW